MEDSSKLINSLTAKREQERARRRMRDRQRRQSMSAEERERHLARRRRNYQLRRQRVGQPQFDCQLERANGISKVEESTSKEHKGLSALENSAQGGGTGFSNGHNTENVLGVNLEGSQARDLILAQSPRRVRLSQIKCLARLLNRPPGKLSDGGQVRPNMFAGANGNSKSLKSLRLNHVKGLARSLNPIRGTTHQDHKRTEVGDHSAERKTQLLSHAPNSAEAENVNDEPEKASNDG